MSLTLLFIRISNKLINSSWIRVRNIWMLDYNWKAWHISEMIIIKQWMSGSFRGASPSFRADYIALPSPRCKNWALASNCHEISGATQIIVFNIRLIPIGNLEVISQWLLYLLYGMSAIIRIWLIPRCMTHTYRSQSLPTPKETCQCSVHTLHWRDLPLTSRLSFLWPSPFSMQISLGSVSSPFPDHRVLAESKSSNRRIPIRYTC